MPKSPKPFEVADALHSAAIHLLRRLRVQDLASGIGPAKLSALSVLVFSRRALSLAELAGAEQVKNPTMSRLVAAMERDGLVSVMASKEDARAMQIRPTRKGERLLLAGKERRVNSLAKVLQDLNESELSQLEQSIGLLRNVIRHL
ncbi:MAG TPA: MarR family transcriptional regulator [Terriglobales bacterium]|nr:MarR family transcriptional regulator [Terriglobales bacterium]